MQNFKLNQVLCMDYSGLEKILPLDSVDLSIVLLPRETVKDFRSKFESVLGKIIQVTKPGGVCCFFVEDTIDPESDVMSINATQSILEVLNSQNDWLSDDNIIWVKDSRRDVLQTCSPNSVTIANFEDTPFTTIHILVKSGSKFESVDFREKARSLLIPQKQKDEIEDDFWHIQPSSESGFTDRIPKKLASRLIMLFSNEGDLVLDPFCGNGVIGVTANSLNRKFLCIDEDETNCKTSTKRINKRSS